MLKKLVFLEMQWAQPVALCPNTVSSKGPAAGGATLSIFCRKRRNCLFRNSNRNFYQLLLKYPQKHLYIYMKDYCFLVCNLLCLGQTTHSCCFSRTGSMSVSTVAHSRVNTGMFVSLHHELLWELT